MRGPRIVAACSALVLAACLSACDRTPDAGDTDHAKNTAVLGGAGQPRATPASAPLTDAQGRAIPAPPLPRGTKADIVRSGPDSALAVWVHDGAVVAASFTPAQGWTVGQPLESIYGEASDARIASNGQGQAIAIWRHTVGNIQSMRFSRFALAEGWSTPDVMPGALPRAAEFAGTVRLEMDAQGNAYAQWPSGFDASEDQASRYVPGSGWTRAHGQPTASAGAAGPT